MKAQNKHQWLRQAHRWAGIFLLRTVPALPKVTYLAQPSWRPSATPRMHQLGASRLVCANLGQGATATVELRHPRTEAHLSQLAVLENFAEHGLYVKFSNEEAQQLEREALALALQESAQEAGARRQARAAACRRVSCNAQATRRMSTGACCASHSCCMHSAL